MSIAPSLFSSDVTHCCVSKRQENICCTRSWFLLLDYQVYTRQHCPGISNTPTQEQLQDTAGNMICNQDQLLPKTPPCAGVTSPAGCPTLDVQQLLCQLIVKQKSLQNSQTCSAQRSCTALRTTRAPCHVGRAPGWHLQLCPCWQLCPVTFSTGK